MKNEGEIRERRMGRIMKQNCCDYDISVHIFEHEKWVKERERIPHTIRFPSSSAFMLQHWMAFVLRAACLERLTSHQESLCSLCSAMLALWEPRRLLYNVKWLCCWLDGIVCKCVNGIVAIGSFSIEHSLVIGYAIILPLSLQCIFSSSSIVFD